jgi:WD40 repeat protein
VYRVDYVSGRLDGFKRIAKLAEHNQVVSAMEWSQSGLLVTCSHDRTSYVWHQVRYRKMLSCSALRLASASDLA